MNCKHKFIHLETLKWAQQAGRNTVTYVLLDRFFCEKCLEKKESKQTHEGYSGEKHGLPDWAKNIIEYVDMGYRY